MLPGSDHPDIRGPWIRSSRYSLTPDQIIPRYSCPPDQIIPRYSRLLDQIIQIFATPRSNHPQIFVPPDQIIQIFQAPDQIIPRYLCSPEQVIQIFTTPDQIILSFLEPTCSLAGGLSPTFINAFLKSLLAIASSFSSVLVTTGSGCHRSLSKKIIGQWKPNLTVLKNDPPLSL